MIMTEGTKRTPVWDDPSGASANIKNPDLTAENDYWFRLLFFWDQCRC